MNPDALQQLSKLKQAIQASKEYAEGVVRGTANRFGFVVLDDGREAFLPPDEMQQVLPGDRVKVSLTENDKKKHEAKLEKLISSELKEFVGRYVIKGGNHFVSADHPQLSRWLFVPPRERKNMQNGDLVRCAISRHPFGDGRAQIKILARIGRPDDIGIERQYMIHKHALPSNWNAEALQQLQAIKEQAPQLSTEGREDLSALPFITIDSEGTLDMDDALYAEALDDGWLLYTAIADPSALIEPDSPLDLAAQERAASVYFPGATLSMFPSELAQDVFSLLPGVKRPTLVCKQTIKQNGEIADFSFISATISSQHKLNYFQVADYLENQNTGAVPAECTELLDCLLAITRARQDYRRNQHLIQSDNWDYIYRLNKQQKIERIERRQPTVAHQVVEEAMLTTNCCAGRLLASLAAEHNGVGGGLFMSHAGFRSERLAEIEQLLKKDKPDLAGKDLQKLEDFRVLFRQLQQEESDSVLLATLKRRLQPGAVSARAEPHFGLGLENYATVTSPIRRYSDLHNHRIIKGLLMPTTGAERSPALAEQLQSQLQRNRQACRQTEQWLLCQFLSSQRGQEFDALVVAVASQGILVRLLDSGAEGFIPIRGSKEEPARYDSLRMTLSYQDQTYHLEQKLRVKLDKVDLSEKQLHLSLSNRPAE